MQIVFTFDPVTRKPTGSSRVQACPRTGALLRPANSLDAPPPVYPDCVVVIAGSDGWTTDLAASKAGAIAQVDKLHAEALRDLTGKATPEERDTWAPKVVAAQALLEGRATQAQTAMIALEAQARSTTPEEMAQRVVKNSGEFEVLCGLAAAFRAKSRAAISAVADVDTLGAVLSALQGEMAKAIAAVKK